MGEVVTLSQCLKAVEEMVNNIADSMDPAALIAHLEKGPWTFLHMNAVQTAEQWMHACKDGRRVKIMVPLPDSPKTWSRRKAMRHAVGAVIEVEQWPLEAKLELTVPLGLTGPEALRGE